MEINFFDNKTKIGYNGGISRFFGEGETFGLL